MIGAEGGDGWRCSVEIGAGGGRYDAAFKTHACVPAVAPEHQNHAREGKNQRGGSGAAGEDATCDQHEADRGDEQHDETAPDKRAVGQCLRPMQIRIRATLDGLPKSDVGENERE